MTPTGTGHHRSDPDAAIFAARPYRAARIVVAALGVAYALSTLIPFEERPQILDTVVYSTLLAVTSLFALARPIFVRQDRAAWICVGLAVTSWSFGDIYWSASFASMDASQIPVPSLADAFYLAMYPLAYAGFILLARGVARRLPAAVWLDGVVTSLAAGALFSAMTMRDILASATGDALTETLTSLAYPIGDLVLMVIAVAALAMVRWRRDPVWWLFALGAGCFAIADTAYLFGLANNTYSDGGWVDGLWMLCPTFIAVAGSLRPGRAAQDIRGLAALLVPIVLSLSALVVLVVGTFTPLHPVTIGLAAGCLVAAGVRTALTFEQTRELVQTRIEAKTDELSGLGNRRALDAALPAMIAQLEPGAQVVMAIISIDHVADINSTLGYPAGDQILNTVGSRIRVHLPNEAVSARLGGVEVAVLRFGRGFTAAKLEREVRDLLAALAEPVPVNDVPVHIELSAGIAVAPWHATDPASLLRCAADALRIAKLDRSLVEIYNPRQDISTELGAELFPDLLRTLRGEEFVAYFEPKVDVASGRPLALEGTLRWHHPTRGVIDWGVLQPLAARVGLTRQFTRALLQSALGACAAWRRRGVELGVTADLSAADVLDGRLPYDLARIINAAGVPSSQLTLELAEDVLLLDPRRTATALKQLRGFGVRLALDHYGRSAPSLTRLRALPVDELKLDASFVGSILRSSQDAAVVRSTVELARSLDIATVAEGIDSFDLHTAVASYGCTAVQGGVIGEPLTLDALDGWLTGLAVAAPPRR